MSSTLTRREAAAARVVFTAANAAAWIISRVHPLVQLPLRDSECEERGLPYGSTEPAMSLERFGLRRLDVWVDRVNDREHCLCFDALGWRVEIYYRPT